MSTSHSHALYGTRHHIIRFQMMDDDFPIIPSNCSMCLGPTGFRFLRHRRTFGKNHISSDGIVDRLRHSGLLWCPKAALAMLLGRLSQKVSSGSLQSAYNPLDHCTISVSLQPRSVAFRTEKLTEYEKIYLINPCIMNPFLTNRIPDLSGRHVPCVI